MMMMMTMTWIMMIDDNGWTRAGVHHKISTILLNCTDQLLESSALEEIVGRTSQCNDVHWALESSTSFSADQWILL